MSDATDFIPKEADIEVNEAYFQTGVKNFADNEDRTCHLRVWWRAVGGRHPAL